MMNATIATEPPSETEPILNDIVHSGADSSARVHNVIHQQYDYPDYQQLNWPVIVPTTGIIVLAFVALLLVLVRI